MRINSQMETVGETLEDRTQNKIKSEPMLFNCNHDSAYRLGSEITREFLSKLPEAWKDGPMVVDSRAHMLMPGWYPCIPGWHHDDVPRTRSDGQPNYGPGQDRSEHIVALVGGDICPTEFATGTADFEEPGLGETIYSVWHRQVDLLVKNGVLKSVSAPSNRLVWFSDRTWHQGTAAVGNGWRFFIRASIYKSPTGQRIDRRNERTNETRKQVQVYLSNPFQGW